jgi:methyl-accepting chemotaxis protein
MKRLTQAISSWGGLVALAVVGTGGTYWAATAVHHSTAEAIIHEEELLLSATGTAAAEALANHYEQISDDLGAMVAEDALVQSGETPGRLAGSAAGFLDRHRRAERHDAAVVMSRGGEVLLRSGAPDDLGAIEAAVDAALASGGAPVFARSGEGILPDLAATRLEGPPGAPAMALAYELSHERLAELMGPVDPDVRLAILDVAGEGFPLPDASVVAVDVPVVLGGEGLVMRADQDRAPLMAPADAMRTRVAVAGGLLTLLLVAAATGLRLWTSRLSAFAREAAFKAAAFNGASGAMMMVDRDCNVTHLNPASQTLLQKNADEFRKVWPSFDPQAMLGSSIDRFHKNPAHQRAILNDPSRLPWRTDITVGEMKFSLNVAAVRDEQGNHVGSMLEWGDVADVRMNRGVIDAIRRHQAVAEYSLDGNLTTVNDNYRSIFGHSAMSMVGQSYVEFIHPDDAKTYEDLWRKLREGESVAGRFRGRGQGGRDIWLETSFNAVLDAQGKPFKVVQIATDVSALEAKVAEKEAVLDALDGGRARITFDPKGNIQSANNLFLAATGYSREEIVGRHHRMFMPADKQKSAEYAAFWRSLGAGEIASGLFRRVRKGGVDLWLQANYVPVLGVKGEVTSVVKFADDVTDDQNARRRDAEERERLQADQQQVVESLRAGLGALAGGDLAARLEDAFGAEYEGLRNDFNEALDTLREAMTSLAETSHSIQRGAGEISSAADDLSRRTEGQAATLEETAAALDQLTASVRSSADGAANAAEAVESARKDAEESGETVRRAVAAMNRIEKSSEQISRIIGVIEDIAFQTNLLALNAGVEAARAGDAGRGFAVVASEVRALAQRSSEAAKEIKDLISESTEQVGEGVDLVGQAGTALEQIVTRVAQIAERVSEIASSAREQSTGLGEINTGVNQLDQVTQQNAAMVEESTAASHALNGEAEQLAALVRRFKTGDEAGPGQVVDIARAREGSGKAAPSFARSRAAAAAGGGGAQEDVSEDGGWHDF